VKRVKKRVRKEGSFHARHRCFAGPRLRKWKNDRGKRGGRAFLIVITNHGLARHLCRPIEGSKRKKERGIILPDLGIGDRNSGGVERRRGKGKRGKRRKKKKGA